MRRIIKRMKTSTKRSKKQFKGQTWDEIKTGLDNSNLGKPSRLTSQGVKLECLHCKERFTREQADRRNPEVFWRYSICGPSCHIAILGIPKDFKELDPESIEWSIYRSTYSDKADEMEAWQKRQNRKIVQRPKRSSSKKRKIIKRR